MDLLGRTKTRFCAAPPRFVHVTNPASCTAPPALSARCERHPEVDLHGRTRGGPDRANLDTPRTSCPIEATSRRPVTTLARTSLFIR